MMDLHPYKCISCGSTLVKKEGKGNAYYACPNYKKSCRGFIFNPSGPFWRVASETSEGTMYDVNEKNGKYYCSCPAGSFQKRECKHKRWVKEFYEDLPPTQEEIENSEMEKIFWDLKERGLLTQYKDYKEYKRGKWKRP